MHSTEDSVGTLNPELSLVPLNSPALSENPKSSLISSFQGAQNPGSLLPQDPRVRPQPLLVS